MPAWSSYTYTFNNPIMFDDPTGMISEDTEPPYSGGIQVYQAEGAIPGETSRADESFNIGDYRILLNYIKNDKVEDVFSHYTVGL